MAKYITIPYDDPLVSTTPHVSVNETFNKNV